MSNIGDCSFCSLHELKQIDLTNTKLVQIKATIFHGIKNLQELHISSNKLESVSKGFLLMKLSKFSTSNLKLCCLKAKTVIQQCLQLSEVQLTQLCPFKYPQKTWIVLLFLLVVIFLNVLALQHTLNSIVISYFQVIFHNCLSGAMTAISLVVFHFEHLQNLNSNYFFLNHNLTVKCKLIAKSLFVLQLYYPFLSVLLYFETYRTVRSLNAKKNCNKQYLTIIAAVISSIITIMQTTGIGDVPSPLCLVNLSFIEKCVVFIAQGLMASVMTALNIALYKHIRKTRKAKGRKQTKNERMIVARFSLYNFVVVVSFVLSIIFYLTVIHHEGIQLTVVIFQFTLAPLAFPVTFILSTQQFRKKLHKKIARSYSQRFRRTEISRASTSTRHDNRSLRMSHSGAVDPGLAAHPSQISKIKIAHVP